MTKETLYYDGTCPLCRREISHLEKIADKNIRFQDVHGSNMDPAEAEARLKFLHLETDSGEVLKGLDANVAAWQHTRWGFLFRPLRWPVIRQIADVVYGYWAVKRFERLYPEGYRRADTSSQQDTCNSTTTTDTMERMIR
ncbi:MAG: DUF393 domain-containing protein [Pseudomonadales bacterium]|jgi:predicted DCC family thiol-disulfide oxidoreductase YuxK|nr:DUF393 domain-containing protein [Pseudomonadales bacterium]